MKLLEKYPYLYEAHLHTSEGSKCGKSPAEDMARAAKEWGYTGIFVTDHHIGGNCRPDKGLPWEEWVDAFYSGYDIAKCVGDEIGLDVFPGWEAGFNQTDFLVYGTTKEWMKAHPELKGATVKETYALVKAQGGMMIHAHPYRKAPFIDETRLFPDAVDGVEIINAQHSNPNCLNKYGYVKEMNDLALAYARQYAFPMTAGSDIHKSALLGGGAAFPTKLTGPEDYIKRILNKEDYVLTDGITWWDNAGNIIGSVEY